MPSTASSFPRTTSSGSTSEIWSRTSHFEGWTPSRLGPSMAVRTSNRSHSYLTTAEVADVFQVSPKTVTRLAREGKLPHSRSLGGHRRYAGDSIRKLATELFRSDDRFVPRG
jgi:excisionase family DNA binding protein